MSNLTDLRSVNTAGQLAKGKMDMTDQEEKKQTNKRQGSGYSARGNT